MQAEAIREQAPQRFVDQVAQQIKQGADEGWDAQQWQGLIDTIS